MAEGEGTGGEVFRFLASGGWADQDSDVIADLLKQAHELASAVATDDNSSYEIRGMARGFLEKLQADTLH